MVTEGVELTPEDVELTRLRNINEGLPKLERPGLQRSRLTVGEVRTLIDGSFRQRAALKEAARFMDYFANGRTEFAGPGTPNSCLAHIEWALGPHPAPQVPPQRFGDGTKEGTEESR